MRKGQRSWGRVLAPNFRTKQTWQNTKNLTFGLIIASVSLKAVSLQLNGMLMMWKLQQAMHDDAIQTARIHPAVHPGNRDEVFIHGQFPARLARSREPSQPALSYEHIKNFTKDLEVRRGLGNWASPVNWARIKRPLETCLHRQTSLDLIVLSRTKYTPSHV